MVSSNFTQISHQWSRIEIGYIGSEAGVNPDDMNSHFVVGNGIGAGDGQIQPTEKWQRQRSIAPTRAMYGSEQAIHISVIVDSKITHPTEFQLKRTEALVEVLSRRFDIGPALIHYPENWW